MIIIYFKLNHIDRILLKKEMNNHHNLRIALIFVIVNIFI